MWTLARALDDGGMSTPPRRTRRTRPAHAKRTRVDGRQRCRAAVFRGPPTRTLTDVDVRTPAPPPRRPRMPAGPDASGRRKACGVCDRPGPYAVRAFVSFPRVSHKKRTLSTKPGFRSRVLSSGFTARGDDFDQSRDGAKPLGARRPTMPLAAAEGAARGVASAKGATGIASLRARHGPGASRSA